MKINELNYTHAKNKNTDNWSTEKYLETLQTNCSEIIQAMKNTGKILVRGIVGVPYATFVSQSPQNRQPSNTMTEFHKAVETKLKGAGFAARRSNSIFCVGKDIDFKSSYGTTFIIFPYDGFEFTWSRSTVDMTVDYDLDEPYSSSLRSKEFKKSFELDPEEFSRKYRFTNQDLISAMASGHEIYIKGKYLAMNFEGPTAKIWIQENIIGNLLAT